MTLPKRLSWLTVIAAGVALVVAVALTAADRRLAASQTVTLVAARSEASIPLDDPSAGVWKRAIPVQVPLSAQLTAPPMGGGARTITVRALHDGARLYVRMEWSDSTSNTSMNGLTSFTDGAAIEFPVVEAAQVPAFCMGNPDAEVNIWNWKAAWQADIDRGGPANVQDAYPNMEVDLYPFEDEDTFYPPRVAGNIYARVNRTSPVDNLVAGSFGTLTATQDQMVQGTGRWQNGRWRVVFARDLSVPGEYTQFKEGQAANIAFAVWDGAKDERDGIKSVSQFVTLDVSSEVAQARAGAGLSRHEVGLFIVLGLGLAALGLAMAGALYLQRRRV